jgi:AcrR family transcriptional regulator
MLYSMEAMTVPRTAPPTMSGLRERKKQRTRMAIFEAAFGLFAERGYDHVTMAEIAQAADVAPATVFTHYSSKEDLFYGMRHEMHVQLSAALRERADDVGVLAAVRGWLADQFEMFLAPDAIERSRTFSRLLHETPALWNRSSGFGAERQALIASLLAERMPDAEPFVVELAAAQVAAGVQTSMRYFQQDLAAGKKASEVLRRSQARADLAFAQLADGLAGVL